MSRHQIFIDLQDAQGYAGLYVTDGRYESPFGSARGTEDILAMFVRLRDSGFTARKRHFNGPVMIDIHGDRATSLSYWWVADTLPVSSVYATGTYRDELRKVDGHWRIAERIQTVDATGSSHAVT